MLGCIAIRPFSAHLPPDRPDHSGYFSQTSALPKGSRLIVNQTAVLTWFVANEGLFGLDSALRDSVYGALLEHVEKEVLGESNVYFLLVESDEFVEWQHKVISEHQFGFCGERVETQYMGGAFPHTRYFFLKNVNMDRFEGELEETTPDPSDDEASC